MKLSPPTSFFELAERVRSGYDITPAEATALLNTADADTLALVAAAGVLRRHYFGNSVKVNYLLNLKSGMCPEDCSYCSQRLGSEADVLKYSWVDSSEVLRQARFGISGGASRVCMVASGRGPSNRDIDKVSTMVAEMKSDYPDIEVCACLGKLQAGQADRLREAGVDAYNHNVNTAESHYENICTTHTYQDRVDTIHHAQQAGLSACSGLIVGMGETDDQLIEALFALKNLDSDSIPVNFLMPFDGTPLAGTWDLSPLRCLRILAVTRFIAPAKELRMAGGRELHLRSLQPVALHVVNSLFLGDYLTSEGQSAREDLEMIRDGGFEVLGAEGRDLLAEHDEFLAAHRGQDPLPASLQEHSTAGVGGTGVTVDAPDCSGCGTSGATTGGCGSAGAATGGCGSAGVATTGGCGSTGAATTGGCGSAGGYRPSPTRLASPSASLHVVPRKRGIGTLERPNA